MKAFITKYWAVIALIAGFVVENATGIIAQLVPDPQLQKLIYGVVTLLYGYYFTSGHNRKQVEKQ